MLTTLLLAALANAPALAREGTEKADLVVLGANVYTLRWDEPGPDGEPAPGAPHGVGGWRGDAEAVGVRDGVIVAVGTREEVLALRDAGTRVVDAAGGTVIPGLVDSHVHVTQLGRVLAHVDLVGVDTEERAVELAARRAAETPAGEWVVGHGWDEGEWANRYPDMALLSERVPDHPVVLRGLHGFAAWGNRLALERAGIDATTVPPSGGEILKDAEGRPTGIVLNRAVNLLDAAIPTPTDAQIEADILRGLQAMAASGYVMVHDAGTPARELAALQRLERSGRLPLRVYAMLSARDTALLETWRDRGADTNGMLTVRSVKAYYDGALGSRGARLLADYSDRPGHRGVSGGEYGFNREAVAAMMRAGFQVGIHAIGDAGNRETLDFLEAVVSRSPQARRARHRIEHAQVLHPADLPRLAELDVIASMEPPHAVEDMSWAEARLGPERVRGAYAWRALRQSGARLTFNSDLPGSDHDIFYGLHAAITRRDKARQPPGGWYASQALSPEEAVRAYTSWAAYAAFDEQSSGAIAPGRRADLTVLSIDPFVTGETRPGDLLKGSALFTIVGGQVVHEE